MVMLDDLVKIHMAAPRFAIQPVKSYGYKLALSFILVHSHGPGSLEILLWSATPIRTRRARARARTGIGIYRPLSLNSCADRSRGEDRVGVAVHNSPGISLASENHGDPQRGRTHRLATSQPPLATLNLDHVAKVRSAVSSHLLETTYRAVPDLCSSVCCRLVDFRRSTARRPQRIRERNVVAPRKEIDHWFWIAFVIRHESLSERLDSAVEVTLRTAWIVSS